MFERHGGIQRIGSRFGACSSSVLIHVEGGGQKVEMHRTLRIFLFADFTELSIYNQSHCKKPDESVVFTSPIDKKCRSGDDYMKLTYLERVEANLNRYDHNREIYMCDLAWGQCFVRS